MKATRLIRSNSPRSFARNVLVSLVPRLDAFEEPLDVFRVGHDPLSLDVVTIHDVSFVAA